MTVQNEALSISQQAEPRHFNNSRYTEINEFDDETQNLKFSLAHYFGTIYVVFIVLLITATITLFIWSNTSDGAWVSLQVLPILPNDTDSSNDSFFCHRSWWRF